jgi:hypothetical protein
VDRFGEIVFIEPNDRRLLTVFGVVFFSECMNGLTINISWEWALGIIGVLLAIAWKGSARFVALETAMEWVKETLKELKTTAENKNLPNPAFQNQSPVNLTPVGREWLEESGLKEYIEKNPQKFQDACMEKKDSNPYEVQKHIFELFDKVQIDSVVEERLKKFAFDKGVSMDILRRIGAIHLRNLCLETFQMDASDIDKLDPERK